MRSRYHILDRYHVLDSQRGISFIEIMVVIAIIVITISMSSGSFTGVFQTRSIRSATHQFEFEVQNAIRAARGGSSAISVCAGLNNNCNTADWNSGYVVVGMNTSDSTVNITRQIQSTNTSLGLLSSVQKIVILPGGFLQSANPVNFYICHKNAVSEVYKVTVTLNGIVNTEEMSGKKKCDQVSIS